MAQIQGGSNTAGVANVDATFNLAVNPPMDEATAGHVAASHEVDAGTVTGARLVRSTETTEDYRLRAGMDQVLWSDWFTATAVNSANYIQAVTTMTVTQTGGYLTLNAGASTASGAVARITTWTTFNLRSSGGLSFRCRAQLLESPIASNVCEWGLFYASGVTDPTDGALFRVNAARELRCVLYANGVEQQSAALDYDDLVGPSVTANFAIDLHPSGATFWIDDVMVARFSDVSSVGPIGAGSVPITFRTYNTAITGTAQQLRVTFVAVDQADVHQTIDAVGAICRAGGHGSQGQTGWTMGSTASYVNSTNPTPGALSNTAALVGGLGGQFAFNAAAAAATDGIVVSYQNLLGSATLTGRSLMIRGVKISTVNMGAAVATTATTLAWSLAYGHTAVSMVTAEALASSTKAPRRVPLGIQTWAVGAAIGQQPQCGDLYMAFAAPIAVNPGEFIAVVAKFLVGTATASQAIWGHVTYDAHLA